MSGAHMRHHRDDDLRGEPAFLEQIDGLAERPHQAPDLGGAAARQHDEDRARLGSSRSRSASS